MCTIFVILQQKYAYDFIALDELHFFVLWISIIIANLRTEYIQIFCFFFPKDI